MFQKAMCSRSDWPELYCSFEAFSAVVEEVSQVCCWCYFLYRWESFFSVASPANSQNDPLYAPRDARKCQIAAKRLLHCRPSFSKSLVVSVALSKLRCSELFFVAPDVKVDCRYYRNVRLKEQVLPVMRWIAGPTYVFQQDSTPARHACDTVQLLRMKTPEFIVPDLWPSKSPDESSWLSSLGSDAGKSLQNSSTWHNWPGTAPH